MAPLAIVVTSTDRGKKGFEWQTFADVLTQIEFERNGFTWKDLAIIPSQIESCGKSFTYKPLAIVFTQIESARKGFEWQHLSARQTTGIACVCLGKCGYANNIILFLHVRCQGGSRQRNGTLQQRVVGENMPTAPLLFALILWCWR